MESEQLTVDCAVCGDRFEWHVNGQEIGPVDVTINDVTLSIFFRVNVTATGDKNAPGSRDVHVCLACTKGVAVLATGYVKIVETNLEVE